MRRFETKQQESREAKRRHTELKTQAASMRKVVHDKKKKKAAKMLAKAVAQEEQVERAEAAAAAEARLLLCPSLCLPTVSLIVLPLCSSLSLPR